MFGRQWVFKLCCPTSSGTSYNCKKWYALTHTPTHTLSVDNVREQSTGKYCVFLVSRWTGKHLAICEHVIISSSDAAETNHQTEV
jgi:hypothetical protein